MACKHPRIVSLAPHCGLERETNIELVLQRGSALREVAEGAQRVFEPGGGLSGGGPLQRLRAGLPEIAHGRLPDFTLEGVVGEPLDVLRQAAAVNLLDGLDNSGVHRAASLLEQAAVRDLVRERVLEGVFGVGEQPCLVDVLSRLKVAQLPTKRLSA